MNGFCNERISIFIEFWLPKLCQLLKLWLLEMMYVYDVDAHACIIDGVRLHSGKRFTYQ
jgi:hypothetical protein